MHTLACHRNEGATKKVAFNLPFVCRHFEKGLGVVYLRAATGKLVLVARCRSEARGQYLYEASPDFVAGYSNVLAMGDVLRWVTKVDIKLWLDRIIFLSFSCLSEQVTSCYWFMKAIGSDDPKASAGMPESYHHRFDGHQKDKWVLLKNKGKVWPVRTTDNRFYDGWDRFWDDHDLCPGYIVLFGAEKKWIFNVVILDANCRGIDYDWPCFDRDLADINTLACEHGSRRCLLSGRGNKNGSQKGNVGCSFTFRELSTATRNFRESDLIGEGGIGRVFKGCLDSGQCIIEKENNFKQPGERYRSWAPDRQERFICRWFQALSDPRVTHERSIWISYWSQTDKSLGQKIANRLNDRPSF